MLALRSELRARASHPPAKEPDFPETGDAASRPRRGAGQRRLARAIPAAVAMRVAKRGRCPAWGLVGPRPGRRAGLPQLIPTCFFIFF